MYIFFGLLAIGFWIYSFFIPGVEGWIIFGISMILTGISHITFKLDNK